MEDIYKELKLKLEKQYKEDIERIERVEKLVQCSSDI